MNPHPKWLVEFANDVTESLTSVEILPPIGCHVHQVRDDWEVTIFASQTEVVGGPTDGAKTVTPLFIDVKQILELFSDVESISWQNRSMGSYDELGCHLAVDGWRGKHHISLRVLSTAPERFTPGRRANVNSRQFEEAW